MTMRCSSLADSGFRVPICATAVEVEIDPEETIPSLLKQARELFDLEAPRKDRSGCEDCEMLASLMDVYTTGEVADKLAQTWKEKESCPVRDACGRRFESRRPDAKLLLPEVPEAAESIQPRPRRLMVTDHDSGTRVFIGVFEAALGLLVGCPAGNPETILERFYGCKARNVTDR